jgi:hypothetical protein
MEDYLSGTYKEYRRKVDNLEKHAQELRLQGVLPDSPCAELHTKVVEYDGLDDTAEEKTSGSVQKLARKLGRKNLNEFIRKFVNKYVNENDAVTPEMRELLGLPRHDGGRTPSVAPHSTAIITSINKNSAEVIVTLTDSETKKAALPGRDIEALLYYDTSLTPILHPEELTFRGTESHAHFTISFPTTERGKPLYIAVRWHNKKGSGPWSEIHITAVT